MKFLVLSALACAFVASPAVAADTLMQLSCADANGGWHIQFFDNLLGGGPAGLQQIPTFAVITKVSSDRFQPTMALAANEFTYGGGPNGGFSFQDFKHGVTYACTQTLESPLQ